MNFDDTPQEAAFRAEAKAWISANAPKQYEDELKKSSLGRSALKGANMLDVAKAWQKKKADAGWACLHWPREYGGRGATPIERVIFFTDQRYVGAVRAELAEAVFLFGVVQFRSFDFGEFRARPPKRGRCLWFSRRFSGFLSTPIRRPVAVDAGVLLVDAFAFRLVGKFRHLFARRQVLHEHVGVAVAGGEAGRFGIVEAGADHEVAVAAEARLAQHIRRFARIRVAQAHVDVFPRFRVEDEGGRVAGVVVARSARWR